MLKLKNAFVMVSLNRIRVNINDLNNALILAARYNHKDILELLLNRGIDINARNSNGDTPLNGSNNSG